jgi:hypothetical protein
MAAAPSVGVEPVDARARLRGCAGAFVPAGALSARANAPDGPVRGVAGANAPDGPVRGVAGVPTPLPSERAVALDSALRALAREAAPLRRELARLAGYLVARRGWERLGFARLGDYAVERLGLTARTLQDLARVDGELAELPALEAAFVAGELSWTKARLLAGVATAADEAAWIAFARARSAAVLAHAVRRVDRGALEAGAAGPAPAEVHLEPGSPPPAVASDEEGRPEEPREGIRIRCTPAVRGKLFRAREQARRMAGEALPMWACMEAVAAEVASALPVDVPDDGPAPPPPAPEAARDAKYLRRCFRRRAAARARAAESTSHASARAAESTSHASARVAESTSHASARVAGAQAAAGRDASLDPFALDARLRRTVARTRCLEARMAPLLLALAEGRRYRALGFPGIDRFARERLGLAPSKARALLRLARTARRSPAFAEAFHTGTLSWRKAQALAPLAWLDDAARMREAHLAAWLAWARCTTVRRLDDDVARALVAAEGRAAALPPAPEGSPLPAANAPPETAPFPAGLQIRAKPTGSGRDVPAASAALDAPETETPFFNAPRPVARFFRAVLCTVRRRLAGASGRLPTAGEALEAMLDHALAEWGRAGGDPPRSHRVFARDGWRCAVPGCSSYRNLHDHHVVWRSAGGSDALDNRLTLCAHHHLRGVHAGIVRITGRAPGRLRYELGLRRDAPPLAVYRSGDRICSERFCAS